MRARRTGGLLLGAAVLAGVGLAAAGSVPATGTPQDDGADYAAPPE
jgi:hypothetical protein